MRLAVIIPCFGQDHMTHDVLSDLFNQEQRCDILLCDNKNDFTPYNYGGNHDTRLLIKRTPQLRWLRGINYGMNWITNYARIKGFNYGAYIWLNNDVRLSPNFLGGIEQAFISYTKGTIGLLAPSYDDVWPQQIPSHYRGPAANYEPRQVERTVLFIDGSCMVVPHYSWEAIGPMDAERFGNFGWGGDLDYALRVQEKGWDIVVTERAYYNHLGGGTNKLLEENYHGEAGSEMHTGMNDKYGEAWKTKLGL